MKKSALDVKLQNLNVGNVEPPMQSQLKFAIISSKKSMKISLWLLLIPFLILLTAMMDSLTNISLPPWSILKNYGHLWPVWVRISIYVTMLIVIPATAAILNLLSIIWMNYDRDQQILHLSLKIKKSNIIILAIGALIAFLFIGHSIADMLAGHD
jgi:hypothetical protein